MGETARPSLSQRDESGASRFGIVFRDSGGQDNDMTQSQPDSGDRPVPRGLWSLMSKASEPPAFPEPLPPVPELAEEAPVPRSLFDVMRHASSGDSTATSESPHNVPEATQFPVPAPTLEPEPMLETLAPNGEPVIPFVLPADGGTAWQPKAARKQSVFSPLTCGFLAVALSTLATRPEIWMSIPASILGFAAIVLGYLKLSAPDRVSQPAIANWATIAGVLAGFLGIFLGPLFFSEMGRNWRDANGEEFTRRHLITMGQGLERYHNQYGTFPAGGTFSPNDAGTLQGMHGWMTFLLPFIGEQSLFQAIDQSKPFDSPANRESMGTEVLTYYAAGGDRSKLGQGYAVAHFAGVGGEIDSAEGTSPAGLFDRNSAVRREDVRDGLSNTLAAGELAGNFPPWGDPENWRTIGQGLNRDINGFGNAKGTGALFLFADGRVRFLGNKTDPKVLQQLSTRSGQDQD